MAQADPGPHVKAGFEKSHEMKSGTLIGVRPA